MYSRHSVSSCDPINSTNKSISTLSQSPWLWNVYVANNGGRLLAAESLKHFSKLTRRRSSNVAKIMVKLYCWLISCNCWQNIQIVTTPGAVICIRCIESYEISDETVTCGWIYIDDYLASDLCLWLGCHRRRNIADHKNSIKHFSHWRQK